MIGRATRPQQDPVAETVLQLAVLLHAGITPSRAWMHLAEAGDATSQRVWSSIEQGASPASSIAALGGSWREVSAAWTVATTVGAPLSESLRGLAAALRDSQETGDDVRVALAEPAGTARLMGWLPLVAVLLGVALGFDTLAVLLGSPIGIGCLIGGLCLLVAAQRWNAALVRRARASTGIPGLQAELLAIGLSGGVSIDRAEEIVRQASGADGDGSCAQTLDLSRRAGVPAVELLRASAALERHRARTFGRLRAARLSSQLLLPLGSCTLPAFFLLGVAPMLLSVLSSSTLTL